MITINYHLSAVVHLPRIERIGHLFFLWPGSFAAFAALREDGELITWGNPGGGGDIHMNDLED